jgi:hypothetical protein
MDAELHMPRSKLLPMAPLPQLVPSRACFSCDVCCRFPKEDSFLRPYFTAEEIHGAVSHGLDPAHFSEPTGCQVALVPDPSSEGYLCPAFDPSTSRCRIYDSRPLDCQLYPLALMWSADGSEVLLGWDSKCPFLHDPVSHDRDPLHPGAMGPRVTGGGLSIEAYADRIASLIERDETIGTLVRHPRLIGPFQEDVVALQPLPRLTERLRGRQNAESRKQAASCVLPTAPCSSSSLALRPLTLDDRPRFERALAGFQTPLAHYAFAPHFVWRERFSYRWAEAAGYFCLFAEYADGVFMPLPPLPSGGTGLAPREAYLVDSQPRASRFTLLSTGARFGAQALHAEHPSSFANVLAACFAFMRERNKGTAVSRIENIPEELKLAFESLGYHLVPKDPDYLYRASDLAGLVGDRYKSQRAACNRFVRVYATAKLEAYHEADSDECLSLFLNWAAQKRQEPCDELASHMLSDAESAHREALVQPEALGLVGRVVRVGAAIRGYTFGYRRSASVFCVLFEVADRTIPGLAQFMFRELCREAAGEGYEFVNTMDDSGLPSLARSKRAYHPVRLVTSFIATEF